MIERAASTDYWDEFWKSQIRIGQSPLWDVNVPQGVAQDFPLLAPYFSAEFPVIDIGCGSGIATRFLATKFERVIGLDTSATVVQLAQSKSSNSGLDFRTFNILSEEDAQNLKKELGVINIYIRGLIHQIPEENRQKLAQNLRFLLGDEGTLYLIETADHIRSYIEGLTARFSNLPLSLKRVLTSHYPPSGVSKKALRLWFDPDKYEVLDSGDHVLLINEFVNGEQVQLPAIYSIIKKKSNA